jgi:hypothetical protein
MTGPRQLSRDAVELRRKVIDACWDDDRFGYIDKDRFVGSCPICAFALIVRFAGYAPRASLECSWGCEEAEIADRIGLQVVR